jgi:hypothetical protein
LLMLDDCILFRAGGIGLQPLSRITSRHH